MTNYIVGIELKTGLKKKIADRLIETLEEGKLAPKKIMICRPIKVDVKRAMMRKYRMLDEETDLTGGAVMFNPKQNKENYVISFIISGKEKDAQDFLDELETLDIVNSAVAEEVEIEDVEDLDESE